MLRLIGRGAEKALMSVKDADLIEFALLELVSPPKLHVLEWGSGKSTVYYTRLLQQTGRAFHWLAMEHNRDFYEAVMLERLQVEHDAWFHGQDGASLNGKSLHMAVFNYGHVNPIFRPNHRRINMDEYVSYPSTQGHTFDVIMVDGRKRRRCLIEAASLLNEGGVVILHDSHRKHYHSAFDHYRYFAMVGDWLWVGSQWREPIEQMQRRSHQGFGLSRFITVRRIRTRKAEAFE